MSESSQSESMLVRSEHLDRLLLLAGEVIVASSNQGLAYRSLAALADKRAVVDTETVNAAKDLAATTSIISSDLHHLVQAIRTVSLKDFGFRARRLVRDLARKLGKRVAFEFLGEETTVDKAIIEKLYDPIAHQLRNALDHGIEDGLTRARAGKSEEGRITLRAFNTERETFIEIEDDGAGVDMEALRERGIASGRITADTPFTEDVALHLMCTPGISTAKALSEVSGRGVGMDVVYSQIAEVGGSVSFRTEQGNGSTFTFRVPLISAVNIVDALVVRAGALLLAFPITNVVASMSVPRSSIHTTFDRGRSLTYLGHLLPLRDMGEVLDGRACASNSEMVSVLVIEHKQNRAAFEVSEFFSPQKLVIIPFEGGLSAEGIVGATVLGGSKLGFIVDVPSLLDLAGGVASLRKTLKALRGRAGADQPIESALTPVAGEEPQAHVAREQDEAPRQPGESAAQKAEEEFAGELEKLIHPLNEAVFRLESAPGDMETVNTAFRLFHTIKGNLIMMGLPKGGETVHSVESVLDRVRSKELELTGEAMDVLMDGVSYVEGLVRAYKSGACEDAHENEIIERARLLLPEPAEKEEIRPDVAAAEVVLSHEAIYRANMHRKRCTPFYQCYIEFDAGMQPPFLVACLIYKRICEVGDVLGSAPPLPVVERGVMDGRFKLLFASTWLPDAMESTLRDLLTRHYGARLVTLTRFE